MKWTLYAIVLFWFLLIAVGPFITCALWMWTVPAILPGAVTSGVLAVPTSVSWWFGFKVMLLTSLFFGTSRFTASSK